MIKARRTVPGSTASALPTVTREIAGLVQGSRPADPSVLLHDGDTKYTASFDEVFRPKGVEIVKSPFQAPNENAHAERFVRTVRSECLDHVIALTRGHLERILRTYEHHYNHARESPRRYLRQTSCLGMEQPLRTGFVAVVPLAEFDAVISLED